MPEPLPDRQKAVYDAIVSHWREHGIAPSTGDLAADLELSRATVHEHLRTLERKGYLDHAEGKARSWRPTKGRPSRVPILGRVAAGPPVFAEEEIEGWLDFADARAGETLFALRVHGDSMTGAGILDGDLVVVRHQATADDGDIVVALVDEEEATVKQLRRDGAHVRLIAMNPAHPPLVLEPARVRLCGRVVGVHRSLREQGSRE